ncbi:MAG: metallophosphoesterase [Clostridia bacterium]|nr:metallophosphoesterase [Clostridia bacterium]
MSLYALGDLHLHFGCELKAKAQLRDPLWRDHEQRVMHNCVRTLSDQDVLVLAGDHSFGRNLESCGPDLQFIMALPGKKVLIRGNHDMFWDAKKTAELNQRFQGRLFFLQNNYYAYGDTALVGTKGYTFEGPFYVNRSGHVTGWDQKEAEHASRLVDRELERLRVSFEAARADGFRKYILFLHYPPTSILEKESGFTRMAEAYGVKKVIYAHCHGQARFHDSLMGRHRGIEYHLVSGDYLKWQPECIEK